jgi:hypothetical protein
MSAADTEVFVCEEKFSVRFDVNERSVDHLVDLDNQVNDRLVLGEGHSEVFLDPYGHGWNRYVKPVGGSVTEFH